MRFLANFFSKLMKRYMPDAFIFALLLSFVTMLGALLVKNPQGQTNSIFDIINYWGNGFWALLAFAMQMALIVATGNAFASSKPIRKMLEWIASYLNTPVKAVVGTVLFATAASWLQYGFGLIAGALLARKVASRVKGLHYPILVAGAYSGFLVWHGGLSGSIPLRLAAVNTDPAIIKAFGSDYSIPISNTLFSHFNLIICGALFIMMPIAFALMMPKDKTQIVELSDEAREIFAKEEAEKPLPAKKDMTPAQRLEHNKIISIVTWLCGFTYLFFYFKSGRPFTLDTVLLIFLFLGIAFHGTPRSYINAFGSGVAETSGILLQFPLYAGIMGIMVSSGLAITITKFFISIADATTLPTYTFLVSGLINLFIPSGGGQWAVMSTFVIDSAVNLGADINKVVMAVSWGDSWTNMIQPFWALPLLGVARLEARDILGYTTIILILSGILITGVFMFV